MSSVQKLLNDPARFAAHLPGFRPRESQLTMATAVENAIKHNETLVVEAETGTGKTLAYLLPALMSEGPVLVSTGTKSLQDQLFFKDLPMVLKVLGINRRVALLKGRANYLCPYRQELANSGSVTFMSREAAHQLAIVNRWSKRTESGDLAELQELAEDAPIRPYVTSTRDNCLGQECPMYDSCPLMIARKKAHEADLVVVNHHLFFADAALRMEGIQPILPDVKTVIFDEAHQLPDVAASFFGKHLTGGQLKELARDAFTHGAGHIEKGVIKELTDSLKNATDDLRIALGDDGRRDVWRLVVNSPKVVEAVSGLIDALSALHQAIDPEAKASRDLENCVERCETLLDVVPYLTKADDATQVFWFENFSKSFILHATPLSVAKLFGAQRAQLPGSWIFTSATLSVAGDFKHFSDRLGLSEAKTLVLPSPFDFRHQSLLYVPTDLPEPNNVNYTDALVDAMLPVIEAAQGRTFFLFTSHRALQQAAKRLEGNCSYPLLVQNTVSRRQLLDDFRRLGNAVLLGTSSFWEGIDVRGDALSCVIIDKLPFESPGDPVVAARSDKCKENGGNPFFSMHLPTAILALRQGVGRLIRDVTDTGVLVLADPRVISKGYGKRVLDSLPPMPKTRQLDVVQRFFGEHVPKLKERLAAQADDEVENRDNEP